MRTLTEIVEIELAVDALPPTQRKELIERLARRLKADQPPSRVLPFIHPTGRPITQKEIDDALDTD